MTQTAYSHLAAIYIWWLFYTTQAVFSPLAAIYTGWLFYVTQTAYSALASISAESVTVRKLQASRQEVTNLKGPNTWRWACSHGARGGGGGGVGFLLLLL